MTVAIYNEIIRHRKNLEQFYITEMHFVDSAP